MMFFGILTLYYAVRALKPADYCSIYVIIVISILTIILIQKVSSTFFGVETLDKVRDKNTIPHAIQIKPCPQHLNPDIRVVT